MAPLREESNGAYSPSGERGACPAAPESAVEVEVARGALLEPQAVMVRGVLEELGGLFQDVLVVAVAHGFVRAVSVILGREDLFDVELGGLPAEIARARLGRRRGGKRLH